jgi:hypothetical protein
VQQLSVLSFLLKLIQKLVAFGSQNRKSLNVERFSKPAGGLKSFQMLQILFRFALTLAITSNRNGELNQPQNLLIGF